MFTVNFSPSSLAATTPYTPPLSSDEVDLNQRIASFRCGYRKHSDALLPRPPWRPCMKKVPPSAVWRSIRLVGRFAAGTPVKKQQKLLMTQLGIIREGEQISDEALQAYLRLFDKPMTSSRIAAVLALFGWEPDVIPLCRDGDVDLLV
uniref:Uncharacterized protein n=1 Tax=Avena sativa TaxID=4498 RepID=A0ACD5W6V6_AVESA